MGSVALHLAVVAAFWISTAFRPEPVLYETYAIDLYSPPPSEEAAVPDLQPPAEELVVETPVDEPEPTPPPPDTDPDPEPVPVPPQETRPAAPPPSTTPTEEPQEPRPSRGPDADPNSPGGEDIRVIMEGLQRDFPEYYDNIVFQINRCFRPPREGTWQTKVDFVINPDGSIAAPSFSQRSGSATFDILAMGAIECAGGRFGQFPEGLRLERLPIRFTFEPRP